jgi:hypothetical protein
VVAAPAVPLSRCKRQALIETEVARFFGGSCGFPWRITIDFNGGADSNSSMRQMICERLFQCSVRVYSLQYHSPWRINFFKAAINDLN